MVKIRLMRVGKKKQPTFRVVVADSRSPRDGRIIEAIGHYHPQNDPSVVNIDNERALYWLQRGAQPSDSVRHLLRISGAWTDFTGEPQKVAPGGTTATAATTTKPAKAKKATPAASVTVAEDQGTEEEVAELPEAVDQQEAAPEAEPGETTE